MFGCRQTSRQASGKDTTKQSSKQTAFAHAHVYARGSTFFALDFILAHSCKRDSIHTASNKSSLGRDLQSLTFWDSYYSIGFLIILVSSVVEFGRRPVDVRS